MSYEANFGETRRWRSERSKVRRRIPAIPDFHGLPCWYGSCNCLCESPSRWPGKYQTRGERTTSFDNRLTEYSRHMATFEFPRYKTHDTV